jgi:hypothetical protein
LCERLTSGEENIVCSTIFLKTPKDKKAKIFLDNLNKKKLQELHEKL